MAALSPSQHRAVQDTLRLREAWRPEGAIQGHPPTPRASAGSRGQATPACLLPGGEESPWKGEVSGS